MPKTYLICSHCQHPDIFEDLVLRGHPVKIHPPNVTIMCPKCLRHFTFERVSFEQWMTRLTQNAPAEPPAEPPASDSPPVNA